MGFKQFARSVLSVQAPSTDPSSLPEPSMSRSRPHVTHSPRGSMLGYTRPGPDAQRVISHYRSELAKIVALLEERLSLFDRDPTEYALTFEIRELRSRLGDALEAYFAAAGSRDTRNISNVVDTVNRVELRLRSLDDEVRAEVARFEATAHDIAACIQPNLSEDERGQYAADANDLLLELFLYRTSWHKAMQPDTAGRLDTVESILRSIFESAPTSSTSSPLPIVRVVDDGTTGDDTSSDSSGDGTYASVHRPQTHLHRHREPGGRVSGARSRSPRNYSTDMFVHDGNTLPLQPLPSASSALLSSSSLQSVDRDKSAGGRALVRLSDPSVVAGIASQPRTTKKRSKDLRLPWRHAKDSENPQQLPSSTRVDDPSRHVGDRAERFRSTHCDGASHTSDHFTVYPQGPYIRSHNRRISTRRVELVGDPLCADEDCESGELPDIAKECGHVEDVGIEFPVRSRSRTLRDKAVLARTGSDKERVAVRGDGFASPTQNALEGRSSGVDQGHKMGNETTSGHDFGSPSKSFASILYMTQNMRSEALADTGMCFQAVSVKGDGRCLFRSVARAREMGRGTSSMSERAEREMADELRARTVCELKKHRALLTQFYVIETDFAKYTKRMSNPKAFGGEPELLMLAKLLHTPIAVYILISGRFKQIQVYGRQYRGDPYRILYSDGVHYDVLRVIQR